MPTRLRRPRSWRRFFVWGGVVAAVLFVGIQAIPYGRDHSNPPVTQEPKWDSARTRKLAADSCFDCHSNLTNWRWYSNVAPMSWLVQRDVDGGRAALNFSEWDKPQDAGIDDITEAIRSGSMPPWFYLPLHPNAKLDQAEKGALITGLNATFAQSPPIGGG